MSSAARRGRTRRWRRPSIPRLVLRFLWRSIRILFMVGVAMGPGAPPPPPPPPQAVEQQDAGAPVRDEQ
jgi:hypothetical protein